MPSDIYTLSLHDALPICFPSQMGTGGIARAGQTRRFWRYWFGCIKTGEQALTSRLARHAHEGDKIIGSCARDARSEEHTSELQSRRDIVCRLLLEKKNNI